MYGASAAALVLASVLPTILFVGMMMGGIMGVMALASRNDIYDEIGRRGHLSIDRDGDRLAGSLAEDGEQTGDPASEDAERELEVRQVIEARSARIVRKGGAPLDVEAEVKRLLAATPDGQAGAHGDGPSAAERDERELEVRQMIEARSARIVRKGGAPLDVEAEVKRLLSGAEGPAA